MSRIRHDQCRQIIENLPLNIRLLTAAALLVTITGCGDGHPDTFPVSGVVLYQDKPVAGAQVTFVPSEGQGRQANGETNAEGVFHLGTYAGDDGALPGKHQVAVSKMFEAKPASATGYAEMKSAIPQKYSNPTISTLTADVSAEGENTFRFELVD